MQANCTKLEAAWQCRAAIRAAPRRLALSIDYAASDNLADMCMVNFGMRAPKLVALVERHLLHCVCPESWIENYTELALIIVGIVESTKKAIKQI